MKNKLKTIACRILHGHDLVMTIVSIERHQRSARIHCTCSRCGYTTAATAKSVTILEVYDEVHPADFYGKWKFQTTV
jgi:hypothetical protein